MTTVIKSNDIVPLLTGRTPMKVNRLMDFYLKEEHIPLSKEQWSVMAVLWEKDGCTQQEIADATFRDRAGITRLLDNLQKNDLVERRAAVNDRRTNLVFLTKNGRKIEAKVVKVLKKTIDAITAGISHQEIENIRRTFQRINENIEQLKIDKTL